MTDRSTTRKERYTLCSRCEKTFTGTRAFDDHRVGTYEPLMRRCLTTGEMIEAGCSQEPNGDWGRRTVKLTDLLSDDDLPV